MTVANAEIYEMIMQLPVEKSSLVIDYVRHLQDEDDEPLTDEEIEQMSDVHADPNMRSTWEEIWQKHLTLA